MTRRTVWLGVERVEKRPRRTEQAAGDRAAAFNQLLDRGLVPRYRLAGAILGNPLDAEDATHDAAVRAWQSFGSLRDPAKFGAWFDRILINVCRKRLRARRPSVRGRMVRIPDPTGEIVEHDALSRAMDALTINHRAVIALRYLEDLTVEQIAERTGVRAGTVKSRLHYALAELRAAYEAGAREVEELPR